MKLNFLTHRNCFIKDHAKEEAEKWEKKYSVKNRKFKARSKYSSQIGPSTNIRKKKVSIQSIRTPHPITSRKPPTPANFQAVQTGVPGSNDQAAAI